MKRTLSYQVKCPFEIKWTLVDHKLPHRNALFYKVKISNIISTDHTCQLSQSSYSYAYKAMNGHTKIDLSALNTAVDVLVLNPSLPARLMRPLLKNVLPSTKNINGKFCDNFRRRVMIYHAKHPDAGQISMEDSISLLQKKNLIVMIVLV